MVMGHIVGHVGTIEHRAGDVELSLDELGACGDRTRLPVDLKVASIGLQGYRSTGSESDKEGTERELARNLDSSQPKSAKKMVHSFWDAQAAFHQRDTHGIGENHVLDGLQQARKELVRKHEDQNASIPDGRLCIRLSVPGVKWMQVCARASNSNVNMIQVRGKL